MNAAPTNRAGCGAARAVIHTKPETSVRTVRVLARHPTFEKRVLAGGRGCWVIKRYERVRTYKSDHHNPRRLRYGWRLTHSGHIVVDAQQRSAIFLMLAMRRDHSSLQHICSRLSTMQCQPPRNNCWYCATVKKIIDQNSDLYHLLPHVLAHLEIKRAIKNPSDRSALKSAQYKIYSKRPSKSVNPPLHMH
jgi:hypothetical protein